MAGIIINPRSRIPNNPDGWSNTYQQARREAAEWLLKMINEGFGDIEVVDTGKTVDDGTRWVFEFRHKVTGVTVELQTHGVDNMDAYLKQAMFHPRVYWNGSSSSNPQLSDFAADGYVMTYRRC